jgi:rubrerythrin
MAEPFMQSPPQPEKLGAMTEENLKAAFAGESQASQKYLAFAAQAEAAGKANTARLFRAAAFAESTHARNHLSVLGGIGEVAANLQAAWGGEDFEIGEMYPAYREVARLQHNEQAATSILYAASAEVVHRALYKEAQEQVAAGGDLDATPLRVCPVCGHTLRGEAPDECPVCGTAGAYFREF